MSTRGSYYSVAGFLPRLATHGNTVLTTKRLGGPAQVVYPAEAVTTGQIRFPMPTWPVRRCWNTEKVWAAANSQPLNKYECAGQGKCNATGACVCISGYYGTHCEIPVDSNCLRTIRAASSLALAGLLSLDP